jgi:cysteine desulfurase
LLTPVLSLPNTVMLHFADVDGRELLPSLDMAGVEASLGSACSAGSPAPPVVLLAMGLDQESAAACVRFSFSQHTSAADATQGARLVKRVVQGLRRRR